MCTSVLLRSPWSRGLSLSGGRDRIKVFRWPMTRSGALPHHRVASSLIQINRFMHRRDLETARRFEKRKRQFPTFSLTKTNGIALARRVLLISDAFLSNLALVVTAFRRVIHPAKGDEGGDRDFVRANFIPLENVKRFSLHPNFFWKQNSPIEEFFFRQFSFIHCIRETDHATHKFY